MQYRKFGKTGAQVSALGLGTMRLPLLDGDQGSSSYGAEQVDVSASIACIRHAIDCGVNYIDTAYNYMGGNSEWVVGQALSGGQRQNIYLATKSPVWLLAAAADFERVLCEQLEKLQTDYIDMYLLHSMNASTWEKALRFGLPEKLQTAKMRGTVRYIGFSFHDELPLFRQIVDTMDWDFCQIQLNYIDTCHQAGLAGLRYAAEKGMAVSIMEPLRGGFLVHPPKAVADLLASHGRTPVQFGLEYLWRKPEVSVVLSGMGTSAQIDENIGYLSHPAEPLAEDELEQLAGQAAALLRAGNLIGCTGCPYCAPGCPPGIPIPQYFQCYDTYLHGNDDATKDRYRALKASGVGTVQQCLLCHQCEKICPQHIAIPEWLKKVDRLLR